MAILEHTGTRRRVTLGSPTLIGRAAACGIRISQLEVSGTHASVQWNGERWEIRDLTSRNGTFVDGKRVMGDDRVSIATGAMLEFGRGSDTWRVIDSSAPVAAFVRVDGVDEVICEEDGSIAIMESDPLVTAYRMSDDSWQLEIDGVLESLRDGREIELRGALWRFSLPTQVMPGTLVADQGFALADVTMVFRVSADEEDVAIELRIAGREPIELGARASFYPLLLLARARGEALEPEDSEAGWMQPESLAEMMRTELTHINVHVFRIRKCLAKAGMRDGLGVVERRTGSGKMRIGTWRFEIVPG